MASALAAVAMAAPLTGCSGGGEPPGGASPEAVVDAVLDAWSAGDRDRVEGLAEEQALDALFDMDPPGEPMEVVTCTAEPELRDAESCLVRGSGASIVFVVRSGPGGWSLDLVAPVR